MPNSQQSRPHTPDENFRELYKRFAQLNDKVSALLNPAWGSEMGIIPTKHPLYQGEKPSATEEDQCDPVDWKALVERRERELKTVGEARHVAEQRAEQVEELLRVAHETSNRSEAERARAVERAEKAEATVARVRAESARIRAVSRTWEPVADLIDAALAGTEQPTGCRCHNGDELCSGCRRCPDICNGCDGPKYSTTGQSKGQWP